MEIGRVTLEQIFHKARIALGEQMVVAGIDDGEIGEQLAALAEEIRQASWSQAALHEIKGEPERLILHLADLALEEDGPLPGAEKEYQRARKAQLAPTGRPLAITACRQSAGW